MTETEYTNIKVNVKTANRLRRFMHKNQLRSLGSAIDAMLDILERCPVGLRTGSEISGAGHSEEGIDEDTDDCSERQTRHMACFAKGNDETTRDQYYACVACREPRTRKAEKETVKNGSL